MKEIEGKFTTACVYCDDIEPKAVSQVKMICDNATAKDSKVRIMPDVHPGKVGPIGLTMTVGDKIMPALIGPDIGCGISYVRIKNKRIEFSKLDRVIRENIPSGSSNRSEPHLYSKDFDFEDLACADHVQKERALLGLGTLGGGNHFIEVDVDKDQNLYIFVHSGSRHLGAEVYNHYMNLGQKKLKERGLDIPYELTYLEGELMESYLQDVKAVTGYAMLNREVILREIIKRLHFNVDTFGGSIHNYVDENRILRKGAVRAYRNDEVIIPVNMRDGIILGVGKGNSKWNYSAPHGGGRVLSREQVLERYTMHQFKDDIEGIHSNSISEKILDEAPIAYRDIDTIINAIGDTVDVKRVLMPIYNYKGK